MTDLVPAPRAPEAPPPLAGLGLADVLRIRTAVAPALEEAVTRGVRWMRLSGASWDVIARTLGVRRQSAWERYRHVDGYPVAMCLVGGVAFLRCEMTGAEFRDSAELGRAGRDIIEHVSTHQPEVTA